jgi:hypothetical protein
LRSKHYEDQDQDFKPVDKDNSIPLSPLFMFAICSHMNDPVRMYRNILPNAELPTCGLGNKRSGMEITQIFCGTTTDHVEASMMTSLKDLLTIGTHENPRYKHVTRLTSNCIRSISATTAFLHYLDTRITESRYCSSSHEAHLLISTCSIAWQILEQRETLCSLGISTSTQGRTSLPARGTFLHCRW